MKPVTVSPTRMSKGGQNPDNTSDLRPAPPKGSGGENVLEHFSLKGSRGIYGARPVRVGGVIFEPGSVEWLACHLYAISDRNPHEFAGFCTFERLPDDIRDVWLDKARTVIIAMGEHGIHPEIGSFR